MLYNVTEIHKKIRDEMDHLKQKVLKSLYKAEDIIRLVRLNLPRERL
jgi:hypothetical protein